MRTRALLLLAGLLALATVARSAEWADVVAPLDRGVLLIDTKDGTCSSVLINAADGYVLTAAHCVPKDGPMLVDGRDATPLKVNALLDLAVLKTRPRKGAITIALAPTTARAGSAVAVIGYPFGARSLTVQIGIVANPDVDGWAWINADLLPGDSGGAIINVRGELVALTSGYRYHGAAHIGQAAPLETIRAFVEDYLPAPRSASR